MSPTDRNLGGTMLRQTPHHIRSHDVTPRLHHFVTAAPHLNPDAYPLYLQSNALITGISRSGIANEAKGGGAGVFYR